MERNILVTARNILDGRLKFPNLKAGDTGIQIGFDFSSPNLTSDLIVMARKVGPKGKVIGIDPDPFNHQEALKLINKYDLPIQLVQKATYREKTTEKLVLTKKASWNRLTHYAEPRHTASARFIEVELDTVDRIVNELGLSVDSIRHINITNNGSEYPTLEGMSEVLSNSKNIALTAIARRPGRTGIINGKRDFDAISDLLRSYGFTSRFYKMSQLFWWGFVHQFLMKRRLPFGKDKFGIVMAHKGKARHPWYQSFS